MTNLEDHFHDEMINIYKRAKADCNYPALRFLQTVTERRGLQAAKDLLNNPGLSYLDKE